MVYTTESRETHAGHMCKPYGTHKVQLLLRWRCCVGMVTYADVGSITVYIPIRNTLCIVYVFKPGKD